MWDQHFEAAGSYGELVTLDAGLLAPAPFSVDLVTAAALRLAAVTASQVLDLPHLPSGARLLVTGISGVVGGLTAQQAAHRGLHVTDTVCSEADLAVFRDRWVTSSWSPVGRLELATAAMGLQVRMHAVF